MPLRHFPRPMQSESSPVQVRIDDAAQKIVHRSRRMQSEWADANWLTIRPKAARRASSEKATEMQNVRAHGELAGTHTLAYLTEEE